MKKIISIALAVALPFALIATADAQAAKSNGTKIAKAITKPAKPAKKKATAKKAAPAKKSKTAPKKPKS